uniref:Putative ovule protein n=1 Tax=Solanum chacoense TaxID=4108 RepID=A0A0V0HVH6_SOLCH
MNPLESSELTIASNPNPPCLSQYICKCTSKTYVYTRIHKHRHVYKQGYQLLSTIINYNHVKQTILFDIRFEIIVFYQRPKVNMYI